MNDFRLDGLTIAITGAGSGIGQATAELCAAAGARKLILVGRRSEALAATSKKVKAAAPACPCTEVAADVGSATGRATIIKVLQGEPRLDGLVNNAGTFEGAALAATTDQLWQRHFDVNVTPAMALTRDLLPKLMAGGAASVVNVSSTLAEKPIPHTAAYNASKAALIQLSRSLALELGPVKIRVNCVLPAIVDTPMYRGRYQDDGDYKESLPAIGKLHPLGRIGLPLDVARAIVFLLGPGASWITGVSLPVDGGMLCT